MTAQQEIHPCARTIDIQPGSDRRLQPKMNFGLLEAAAAASWLLFSPPRIRAVFRAHPVERYLDLS